MTALGVLYTFRRCPYAMRARLALRVAELDLEVREVALSSKPQALIDVSPKATVPVLHLYDGRVLAESLDIMRWSLAQRDPEGWLTRGDPSRTDALIATNDGPFKRHLDAYKYSQRHPGTEPEAERAMAVALLQPLEAQLARGPYLFGSLPALADMALAPFVRQFASVDPQRFARELPRLDAWRARIVGGALFERILRKCPVWVPGQSPVSFMALYG